jgi:hypothetical protein
MKNATGCTEANILVIPRMLFFPPRTTIHPVILCNDVFCRERLHDSNIKML